MKVAVINEYKEKFKEYLRSSDIDHAFYFEIIANWQECWKSEATDFAAVYDASLQSEISGRLWGGSTNSAKSMMLVLIREHPDFIRDCFRDLFNETLDLGLRLDRFGYHADQILRPMMGKNPKLSTHHHNDREILCLYLALQYPKLYCLFDYQSFLSMMTKFESRNIPQIVEVERYYKSCRGIYNLIIKDGELIQIVQEKIGIESLDLMLMSLFMEFVAAK